MKSTKKYSDTLFAGHSNEGIWYLMQQSEGYFVQRLLDDYFNTHNNDIPNFDIKASILNS